MMEDNRIPIVLTGFGPFGGVPDNPSSTLVRSIYKLSLEKDTGFQFNLVNHTILETSVEGAKELSRIQTEFPNAVLYIHLGVHGGAKEIRVEHQAYNQDDFRIPDNNGVQLRKSVINKECPAIYQSSVNVPLLVDILGDGYCVSNDPGRFLCNHVFFQSLCWCAKCSGKKHCLFLHVPPFEFVPEEKQAQLLVKLLNTLCCNFTKFASGPPIGIESTIEQETTFSASVDVGNSTTIKNGEQKKNTDTLPQAVLDLGFDPKQIASAMALLPDELKQDPQRIIECIVNMGTSFEEVQYMTA